MTSVFSSRCLTISIATVTPSKELIIGCRVTETGWKLNEGLEIGPSLQNQNNKNDLRMVVVSYTNISPKFILILNMIHEKQNVFSNMSYCL